jgi:hypothetical protein
MRLRVWRWSSWLAVAALLLHASAVARHNVIQIETAWAGLAAFAAPEETLVCHVQSDTDGEGGGQKLPAKGGDGAVKPCPVCLGLISVHFLPASEAPYLRVPQAVLASDPLPQGPDAAQAVWLFNPPNRGPPSTA